MENESAEISQALERARATVRTESIAFIFVDGGRAQVGAHAPTAGPYLHVDVAGGEYWGQGADCACQRLRPQRRAA